MKSYNKLLGIVLAVLFVLYTPCVSFADNKETNYNKEKYEEYHDQINFEDLMICVINKKNIFVTVDPTISFFKKFEANKQKKKYDKYVENHPEVENELLDSVNSSDHICAISYTEAPLIYVDDHYERIPKEDNINMSSFTVNANAADKTATSSASVRHRLTLNTSIVRRGTSAPYIYTARTYGTWDNSVLSGEKAPAAGNDFILQACPTVTSSVRFSSKYNYETNGSKNGIEGKNYFKENGGDSWVQYEVVDDPAGLAQLSEFSLSQTFRAQITTETKKINSYYIHTWKQMDVTVSVSGSAGVSGGKPSAGVSLSFTPSIKDKQWQLYNYIAFNW